MFLSPDSEVQALFQLNAVTVTYRTYPEVGGDSRRAELARAVACQFGRLPAAVWASQQGELGLEDPVCHEIPFVYTNLSNKISGRWKRQIQFSLVLILSPLIRLECVQSESLQTAAGGLTGVPGGASSPLQV